MKEWIIQILSSALLTGILSIVLPDGKITKTIKGVFAVFTALIIIRPVVGSDIFRSFDFSEYVESEITTDENYLSFINAEKKREIEKQCLLIFEEEEIFNVKIDVEYNDNSYNDLTVKKITVNLSDAVIKNENERINNIEKSVDKVCKYLKISRDCLTVYE